MKKTKDILILDAEGVILNALSGIKKFLDHKGICTDHLLDQEGSNPLRLVDLFGANSLHDALLLYAEYCDSEYIGSLDVISTGVKRVLIELSYRYDISLVMSCGRSEHEMRLREKNLEDIFGDIFSGYHFVGRSETKRHVLELLRDIPGNKIAGLIDINEKYVQEGIELGIDSYLFSNQKSRSESTYQAIEDWKQIEDIFLLQ
ncbi:hypothetical protein D051_0379 [Vibrio parahaemolyticus VPCR-2010]|uniref:hypothetical protein n=1 Tax=Vibrio parahaemolyticus TaxID=670 RepID=UPI00038E60D1|nr:hypothetical protein D051_0379 [Vibrio parahaemolyticus VPCR-2010]